MRSQETTPPDGAVDMGANRVVDDAVIPRHVVKVSSDTVAAAYVRAKILTSLGLPVPPGVAKIAKLARP